MKQTKKTKFDVPEWAAFFNEEQYNKFISCINNYLISNDISYDIHGDVVTINEKVSNQSEEPWTLYLIKIAKQCLASPQFYWEKIISDYFQTINEIYEFEEVFKENSNKFFFAKPFLSVKLYRLNTDIIPEERFEVYSYLEHLDIYAELIFDFPNHRRKVTREELIIGEI